jgi:hypothetical protein
MAVNKGKVTLPKTPPASATEKPWAASIGWAVEARVTDPSGPFAGAALGRTLGDADWLPFGSARTLAA